jgi:N-acetylglucosamine-6-phosphate deacetylase
LEKVLRLVTSNPARILGLPGKGRIALGYDADFLLLDENLRICATVARGRILFRS